MKIKFTYIGWCCLFINLVVAQTKQFNFGKANCQLFNNNIYCFGINKVKQANFCTIYKLNIQLQVEDSITLSISKGNSLNYLQLFSDTLHGFLNIYLQQPNKKVLTIVRLNKQFELVASLENVDIARVNSISNFENEFLYYKNDVYTIRHQADSGKKQFYLNKYSLKSELKNFEYEFKWQFPFDRKNINSVHVFFANKTGVFVYVNVSNGNKFGQWILKVNPQTGKLIRGTKLNDKGETSAYQFSSYSVDTLKKSLTIVGQRFTREQFDQEANKLAITNAPYASIYLIEIDSMGDIFNKQDFKIPIVDIKTNSKKTMFSYILRINSIIKNKESGYCFEGDVYKNIDNSLCFLYCNTTFYNLIPSDNGFELEKSIVTSHPLIEKYYFTNDKLDRNGKLCVDSMNQFETLFYKPYAFPVKKYFKKLETGFAGLLTRSDAKKNTINFSILNFVNNVFQLTQVADVPITKSPNVINIEESKFLLCSQEEEEKFQLKIISW